MKADSRTETEVTALLKHFADAYGRRDMKAVLECFAPDGDVVLYGTGADEKRIGLDQIRIQTERDWAQAQTGTVSLVWTSVSSAGAVAWAAVDAALNLRIEGRETTMSVRISFVLEKRESRWLIVHAHFSVPAAGQEEGQSF